MTLVSGAMTACSSVSTEDVMAKAIAFNEATHDAAELHLCKGYAVGTPPERYRGDALLLGAWAAICQGRQARLVEAAGG